MAKFEVEKFDVLAYDSILARGLGKGLGTRGSMVCVEAAICQVLGLPHGDDPGCVAESVRRFKIRLNDARWSSPGARARGLRDLGLAQLGSRGVVDDRAFSKLVGERVIRELIPRLFREVFPGDPRCLAAADRCEKEGTREAVKEAHATAANAYAAADATAAAAATYAAYAAYAAAYAANAAAYAANAYAAANATSVAANATSVAADAAYAAADAASVAADANAVSVAADANAASVAADAYLVLGAKIALDALRELKSPGVALL